MANSRRILSVVLSIVMVLTVVPMGMFTTAGAAPAVKEAVLETTGVDDGTGKLVVPIVTLTSTPVFRIANSSNVFLTGGHTLVSATDSGLPEISSTYSSQFYAGETPHGYTVVLESDKVLSGTPSLGCSVPGVSISAPVKSGNTYTWTITNGSASFNVGAVEFTADYTYSYTDSYSGQNVTTQYQAFATSYAENVTQGAGVRLARQRNSVTTHEQEHMDFVYRMLGANSYGAFIGGSSGYSWGYFDWINKNFSENNSAILGFNDKHGDNDYDGNEAYTMGWSGRALLTTYVDRNGTDGAPLTVNNIRFSFFENENRSNYTRYVRGLKVLDGFVDITEDSSHNNTAGAEVGRDEVGQTEVNGYSETHYGFSGSTYNNRATEAENGNLVSQYSIFGNAGTYYSKTKNVCNTMIAIGLEIQSYDKSELRAFLNELLTTDEYEETSPALDSGIGINPQGSANTNWYKAGFSSYMSALRYAQTILNKPNTNQQEIDLAYTNLETAVNGLQVREADTTQLDLVLADFATRDPNRYEFDAWNAVLDAYDAAMAEAEDSIFYQSRVNKATADLAAALAALQESVAPADWSLVEEAVAAYEEVGENAYTDDGMFIYTVESWTALRNAVTYAQDEQAKGTYTVNEQATVDAMAQAIADAIDNLQFAPADYTAYDAQVARYNSVVVTEKAAIEEALEEAGIDLALLGITNIYTAKTWNAMQNNLNISRAYTFEEQETVDDYTAALKKAIDNRTLVDAVYTIVDNAFDVVYADPDIDPSWYTEDSWADLEDAMNAVVDGKKINEQPTVNQWAQDILDAFENLVEADANYDEFDALCEEYDGLNEANYTADSWAAVQAAIDNIYDNHYNHTAKEQGIVDTEVAKIQTAIDNLQEIGADYTAVLAAIDRWNNFAGKDNYTAASVAAVANAINNVDYTKTISQQAQVNAMAAAINSAIDNLQAKPADYTALKTAFDAAKAKVTEQNNFASANGGKKYYTTDTFSALQTAIAAVPVKYNKVLEDKTIFEQADVDALTAALNAAIEGLQINGADFTALVAALGTVPAEEDLENEELYVPETVIPVNVAVINAQAALDSQADYTIADQADIDALTQAVIDAVNGLKYQPANYAALIARLAEVPADLTIYTADSVAALNAAIAAIPMENGAVKQDKTVLQQADVDAMYTALDNAIKGLTEDFADYTTVDEAIAAANAKTATGYYTDDSVAAVTTAINAVVRGKYAKDQADVDAMAAAINAAAAALVEKPLDQTAYNAVEVPADLTIYTADSVAAYTAAKDAADAFYAANGISKQAEYDVLVADYAAKKEALKLNAADYTLVDQYIAEANALTKANYVDFSGVDTAIANVVRDLDGTKQAQVDAMAQAIRDAIDALVEKPLDLTTYNAVTTTKDPALCTDATVAAYNNAKAAADAYKDDDATNKISNQSEFEKLVKAYKNAAAALAYKPADYTALDALVASTEELDPDNYDNYDDIYWGYIFGFVSEIDYDLDITAQDDVDAMVDELQSYIDMLEVKGADYTAVNAKVAEANAEIAKNIYTDASVAALEDIIADIDYTKDILHQSEVDAYVPAIEAGIKALELKDADYTELEALIDYVNALAENFGEDEDGTVYVNFDDIYWSYMFNFLMGVEDYYGLKIDEQDVVDGLTAELQSYIDMLETDDEPIDPPAPVESFEFVDTADVIEGDEENYVYGFKTNLTKAQFENYVECDGTYYEIEYSAGRYIGTGSVVRVYSESTDELLNEYIIIIYGDVDGNAKIDSDDAAAINLALSGEVEELEGVYKLAANVFGARANVNMDDIDAVNAVASGAGEIDQVEGKLVEED